MDGSPQILAGIPPTAPKPPRRKHRCFSCACQTISSCYARLSAQSIALPKRTPDACSNNQRDIFMTTSSLVHPAASAPEVRNVNHPVRSEKLTRPAASAQAAIQPKPAKKRSRIPPVKRIRVMQRYASGENQTAIARQEGINRETVGRIVKGGEMESSTAGVRGPWRGLCDDAIQSVRRLIAKDDKQAVFRVLESNGIIAPQGQVQSSVQAAAKPNQDDRMKTLRACFADVMMERARVFKTPMPELNEIANQHGIKLDFALSGASDESDEEDEI